MSAPSNTSPKIDLGFTTLQKCSRPECSNAKKARGLCWRHYKQAQRNGGALGPLKKTAGVVKSSVRLYLKREAMRKLKDRAAALGLKASTLAALWVAEKLAE